MGIRIIKKCPDCSHDGVNRIPRKWNMRLIPFTKHYQCKSCRSNFVVNFWAAIILIPIILPLRLLIYISQRLSGLSFLWQKIHPPVSSFEEERWRDLYQFDYSINNEQQFATSIWDAMKIRHPAAHSKKSSISLIPHESRIQASLSIVGSDDRLSWISISISKHPYRYLETAALQKPSISRRNLEKMTQSPESRLETHTANFGYGQIVHIPPSLHFNTHKMY